MKDLCCKIKDDKCQCEGGEETEGGSGDAPRLDGVHCLARGQPCLMAKLKKPWKEAKLPLKAKDHHILEILKKIIDKFNNNKKAHQKAKHSNMAEKYYTTTVNLAPSTWEEEIRHDPVLTATRRNEKITLLADYIGKHSTRSGFSISCC